jgi:O-antigen/teichoic acid export membrane protein
VAEALMPEVAAAEREERAVELLFKSLRLTGYSFLILLIPLWLGAPLLLRVAYGREFLAATETLRLLFVASMIWSAGAIVSSGLNGMGRPGLVTLARLASAVVTVVALIYWLPSRGIVGAAWASLAGYSVIPAVGLFWLARRQRINLWEQLRPRWGDIPVARLRASFIVRFVKARGSEA